MAADAHAAQTDRDFASMAECARSPARQAAGVELGDISEHDLHIVDAAVVDQRNRYWIHLRVVHCGLPDTSASARRIGYRDLIAGVEEPPDDVVLGPRRRMQGSTTKVAPWRRRPRMLSRPARVLRRLIEGWVEESRMRVADGV